eukprot:2198799-Pleurochrysis_carterae.AAC.1
MDSKAIIGAPNCGSVNRMLSRDRICNDPTRLLKAFRGNSMACRYLAEHLLYSAKLKRMANRRGTADASVAAM